MTILLFNLWPYTAMTIFPVAKNAKVGTKVCQILKKLSTKLPKYFQFFAKVENFHQIWSQ